MDLVRIRFRSELLIEKTIFFVPEIHRTEAVLTPTEICRKMTVAAVVGIDEIGAKLAIGAVAALVAGLTVIDLETIHTIKTAVHPLPIQALLRIIRIVNEVAIFEIARMITKIGILHGRREDRQRKMRHFITELTKLIKEGPRKIEIPPIVQGIPVVPPPLLIAVDREGFLHRIHADDGLPREITASFIQLSLIAIADTALLATRRTQGRLGNQILLSFNQRGDLVIKRPIGIGDVEWSLALVAGGH
jgi:hypothetical protein